MIRGQVSNPWPILPISVTSEAIWGGRTNVNFYQQLTAMDQNRAKGYQPVHGSLHSKLLFCTLIRLSSRYLKQKLLVFA